MRTAVILAVLPDYRGNFLNELLALSRDSGDEIEIAAGDKHLDITVQSAGFKGVRHLENRHLLGHRLLWQKGALSRARHVDTIVADLNPRSLTAWALIAYARITRKRILLWGHMYPRRGPAARTAPLRRVMRRLATGLIAYTWDDARAVLKDEPSVAVWVAANGLYPVDALGWDETTSRFRLLYVGRMEPAKKPELLLDGFERALRHLPEEVRLTFVGGGSLAERIESSSHQRGISTRVDTLGHIADYDVLKQLYSEAFASASPGYAGLSLTQSLGFGVPMIVADREPHAPEIELMNKDVGVHFREDDSESLSRAIVELWRTRAAWNHTGIVESVARSYSSTAMAQGFFSALQDDPKGRL